MGWFHSLIDWLDPDWFQAIASIAAIAAGFGYVGLEQRWARRRDADLQAKMRQHAYSLCMQLVNWQRDTLSTFRLSNMTSTPTEQQSPSTPARTLAMELMTMPVADLGDPALASLVRFVGANAVSFMDEAQQSAGTVCDPKVLQRMTTLAEKTVSLVEFVKAKSEA